MPITTDHVEVEYKPKLGGGGPGKTPHRHGYGGGDDGDHGQPRDFHSPRQRLYRLRLLIGICLFSVTVLFIVLVAVYVFRLVGGRYDQDSHRQVQDWIPLKLPYFQLWMNSLVLVLSSITLEAARRRLAKKEEFAAMGIVQPRMGWELPWLGITLLLGIGFLAGQFLVWKSLQHQGAFQTFNPSRSLFYLVTGAHAVHLVFGLVALVYIALARRFLAVTFDTQKIAVEITGWYWHYLAFLWFGIFALVHFARG